MQVNLFELLNNLPSQFSHEITGLVGRKKEISDLKKRLLGARYPLVAVVAPGGIGKTALVLEVLHQISQIPDASETFDRILYFSAKRQALTLDGPRQLNSIETFSELAAEIAIETGQDPQAHSPFPHQTLTHLESTEKVLLCIDNVETFLLDDATAFHGFYEILPEAWKVVVTSRIPIDAASTLPLEELDAQDGKILARIYARSRGMRIDDAQITSIPDVILINPLAVRLVIDGIGRGKAISDAVSSTQGDILEFSYSNLVTTLNNNTVLVLEALLAKPDADRLVIEQLTGLGENTIADSLSQLARTSLLRQPAGSEGLTYHIADGVRDLILTNERNFQAREIVRRRLQELDAHATQAVLKQTARGIDEYHWAFLPEDASDYTMQRLSRLWPRILSSKRIEEMAEIKRELDGIASLVEETEILYAYYSVLHIRMKDYGRAKEYITRSIELSRGLPRYRLVLATVLWHQQEHEEQIDICRRLIDEIGTDPNVVGETTVRWLLTGYFLPHIWSGKYEEVISETKDWKRSANKSMLGTFRASAIKRASERMKVEEAIGELSRCAGILDEVIRGNGYDHTVCKITAKVIEDFAHRAALGVEDSDLPPNALRVLDFCERHLEECMKSIGRFSDYRQLTELFASLEVSDNPFRRQHWLTEISEAKVRAGEAGERSEYVSVDVYHIPERKGGAFPSYIFARDIDGNQYFLLNNFVNINAGESWEHIREGDSLRVVPDFEKHEPGKAIPVSDIVLN